MRKVYLLLILLCSTYVIQAQTYPITTCSGVNINYSNTAYPGATYIWGAPTVMSGSATGTGGGTGLFVSQTLSTTATAAVLSYSVTESFGATTFQLLVTVNPVVPINHVPDLTVCYGTLTSVTFSSSLAGTTFSWLKDPTAIGFPGGLTGTGNIAAFTATTNLTVPTTSVFSVTPFSNSCAGASTSFSITVYPLPTVNAVSDQAVCNGFSITATTFTGQLSNTTYRWTTTNVSIASGALGSTFSGTGNIPGFTGNNVAGVPLTALIVVTPMSNSCAGSSVSFSLTVNPTPTINPVGQSLICNNTQLAVVSFTGVVINTAYNWVNNNTLIGLAASGTGNIAPFTATNASNAPITALVTVTPVSNTCAGTSITFTIIVEASPVINPVTDQVVCNGVLTTPINFSGSIANSTYNWTSNIGSIGIGFGGTGNIAAFSGTNASSAPITALVTVTPVSNTCSGSPYTFSITVNPTPVVDFISNQVWCNNVLASGVSFTGPTANSTFSWTNSDPTIGIAASATGNIAPFTIVNSNNFPVTALIAVTATSNTCTGPATNFEITINPTPVINSISDQVVCAGTLASASVFTGSVPNAVYNWSNTAASIGIAFTGTSTSGIGAFTASNSSNTPVTALITVTPVSNTCSGTPYTFSITVNPTPLVNTVAAQVGCNNTLLTAVTFSGSVAGAQYDWTSNTTAIGIASAGSTTINPFTGTNASNAPITAIITVTAISNTCAGPAITFTYTINPTPTINAVADQVFCNGVLTTAVAFGGTVSGTTFNWANTNGTIGLATSGTGNIGVYTATNISNTPVTSFISITPTANTCVGTATTFSITVNPTPNVTGFTNQAICDGTLTSQVNFTSLVSGAIFNWTNTTTSIGLASSGSGTINAFTGTNTTGVPVSGNIAVTPLSNSCAGPTSNFVIVVNPVPVINFPGTQVVCNGVLTTAVNFTLGTTISSTLFNWSNNNASIGLALTGTSNISAFTATNSSTVPVTADITVTAVSNTCSSVPVAFSITVNPTPSVNAISNQAVCDGSLTTGVVFGGNLAGAIYNWTNTTSSIGLAVSGSGTIAPFTVTTSSNVPVYATIVVTPFSNTCTGASQMFTITVNPVPVVTLPADQVICNGLLTSAVNFTGSTIANTVYTWTNTLPGIGISSGSTGNITAFTATNPSNVPVVAVLTVNAASNTCTSLTQTFTITVNPTPTVNAISSQVVCLSLSTTAVIFSGTVTNTSYNWTNSTTLVGLGTLTGTGNIGGFVTTNGGSSVPISALIVVTPVSNSCSGASTSFTITVNPTPTVNAIADQFICNNLSSTPVIFTGLVPNTTYQWTNPNPGVGLAPLSGTGNIAAFSATNGGAVPINSVVTVTPISNTCAGAPFTFSFVVNPTPTVNGVADQVLCNGVLTAAVTFTGNLANTTYNWLQTNATVGLAAISGTGNIASFTANNSLTVPINSVITVTPLSNACTGNATTFSIVVNPTPTVAGYADQVWCNTNLTTAVVFTGAVTGTTYQWTQTNPAAGLTGLTGTGNIPSFSATNPNFYPINTIISVTPMSNSCNGTTVQYSYVVNPTPTVSTVTNQVLCTGVLSSVTFAGFLTNTVYTWTQTNNAIGLLPFSSTGNIAAFTTTNVQSVPIHSVITVTPSSNTCTGASTSFSIVVNPLPTVNGVNDQFICNGILSNAVVFSGYVPNTSYQWVQTNVAVGLVPISGTGTIAAFTATAPGNVPLGSLVTVTPMSNACTGATIQFSLIANPTPTLNPIGDQVLCNGVLTTATSFTGLLANTTYQWTHTNTQVGLAAFSGTGNIGAFAATNLLAVPIHSIVTVTPLSNTCAGTARTFSYVVNPTPTLNPLTDQLYCNTNITTAVVFSGFVPNTSYQWTNTNVGVGLSALSGTGTIASFTATNASGVPIISQVTVTPMSNSCVGTGMTFSYVVNPTPTVAAVSSQVLCNGFSTTAVVFTGTVANTRYSWVSTSIATGLTPLTGTGNIASFAALNTGGVPINSSVTVTPFSNTCTGASTSFSFIVNPTPTVAPVTSQSICNGFTVAAVNFTGAVANTTYTWTNSNSGIGLASLSGSGNIAAFLGTNAGTAPISARLTVTPMSNSCTGASLNFTITINPTPLLSSTLTPAAICSGALFSYTATSATAGTGFSWNRSAIATINSNITGSGVASVNEQLFSTSTAAVTVPYLYILTANGCTNSQSVTVDVNPTPTMNSTLVPTAICSGTIFTYTATSSSPGATFSWTRIFPAALSSGGAASATTSSIAQTIANSTTAPAIASYAFTVAASGCTNPQAYTVTVSVNPIPVLSSTTTPPNICSGTAFSYAATSATVGTSFAWTRTAATGIATASPVTGTGNSIFHVLNNSNTTLTPETYNITLTANNCINSQPVTVNVYPVPVLNTSLTPAPVCSNSVFSYTPGSATGTIFNWTRAFTTGITNTSASGSGDPAETLISTNPLPVSVIYTYSIITAAGCNNAQTVTATINPLPTLSSSLTPPAICTGVTFNYPPTSNTPGTVFNWTRPFVSGVTNASSTGFNNPFETLSNPTITPVAVVYNYTLTANGCSNLQPVTVFVNPIPVVGAQSTSICSNSTFTVTPNNVPAATLYTWAAPAVTPAGSTLGSAAQPTGVTPISQFLNNQTVNASTLVYTVLPTASGCSGNTFTVTVTVNPTPVVGSQTMTATCSGTPFNFVSGGVPAGTTYTWASPELVPANGLTGGSAQPLSQPAVSQTLNSTNNVMDTAVYAVTPATILCVGTPFQLTVPIKPVPLLSNLRDTICSGNAFVLNPSPVPANTTYTWTAPVITPAGTITGGSAQTVPTTGISQTLTNNSAAYAQAAYTITPSALICAGPSFLLIETVNRSIPNFAAQAAVICSGTAFNANPANAPAGTLYTWPVPVNPPPVGITGSSAVSVPVLNVSQVLSNNNNVIDTVTYTVTPLVNNCPGVAFTAAIRVLPLPKATISGPTSVCANTAVDTVSIALNGTGPWSFTYSDGTTTNTRTGITATPYRLTLPPLAKNITRRTITVMNVKDATCSNNVDSSFFTQNINPLPVGKVISLHGNYLCNGIKDTLYIQSPDSLGYQWQLNGVNIPGATLDSISTTTAAGSYNALLTNKFGCVDTAAVPVNLILVKPPVLKMTIDTTCINSITTFTNKTDTAFTGAIQWNWTFGKWSYSVYHECYYHLCVGRKLPYHTESHTAFVLRLSSCYIGYYRKYQIPDPRPRKCGR